MWGDLELLSRQAVKLIKELLSLSADGFGFPTGPSRREAVLRSVSARESCRRHSAYEGTRRAVRVTGQGGSPGCACEEHPGGIGLSSMRPEPMAYSKMPQWKLRRFRATSGARASTSYSAVVNSSRVTIETGRSEVSGLYCTDSAPCIVNSGREEQGLLAM